MTLQSQRVCVGLIATAALLALSGESVYACTTSWNGSVSDIWTLSTNWSGGTPSGSSDVCIANATNNPVLLSSAGSASTLTIGASSSLSIGNGASLTIAGGSVTNSGSLIVGNSGSTLNAGSASYTQSAGSTLIKAGGTLTAPVVNLNGGSLQVDGALDPQAVNVAAGTELFGTGTITANVDNKGSVFLGDDPTPGTLSVTGDYTQESGGTLITDLLSAADFGLLNITGNLNADGFVNVGELSFAPLFDELFKIITFTGSLNNTAFAGVTGVDAADWNLIYDAHDVQLQWNPGGCSTGDCRAPLPEPRYVLLDVGLVALAAAWRVTRRRRVC